MSSIAKRVWQKCNLGAWRSRFINGGIAKGDPYVLQSAIEQTTPGDECEMEQPPEDSEDDDASLVGVEKSEPSSEPAECERLFKRAVSLCSGSGGDSPRLRAFLRRYCSMKENEVEEGETKKPRVEKNL